jgi:hypothetical protein
VRLSLRECGRTCGTVTGVGTGLVLPGGTLKAIWKLLYTLGVGDFVLLSEQQFVLLAPGFLLMLVGAIQLLRSENRARAASVVGMAVWKIPLMALMTISSIGAYGILSFIAFRRRQPVAGLLFVLTIVLTLGMAGMAGGEQSVARQWVEEGANSLGQIALAVASWTLYRRSMATARSG